MKFFKIPKDDFLIRYITASSGVEQIECLIGPTKKLQADPYWIRFLSSVELVSIKVLSKDVGIFSDSGTFFLSYLQSNILKLKLKLL